MTRDDDIEKEVAERVERRSQDSAIREMRHDIACMKRGWDEHKPLLDAVIAKYQADTKAAQERTEFYRQAKKHALLAMIGMIAVWTATALKGLVLKWFSVFAGIFHHSSTK